jgi:hypothetical protein
MMDLLKQLIHRETQHPNVVQVSTLLPIKLVEDLQAAPSVHQPAFDLAVISKSASFGELKKVVQL